MQVIERFWRLRPCVHALGNRNIRVGALTGGPLDMIWFLDYSNPKYYFWFTTHISRHYIVHPFKCQWILHNGDNYNFRLSISQTHCPHSSHPHVYTLYNQTFLLESRAKAPRLVGGRRAQMETSHHNTTMHFWDPVFFPLVLYNLE